MITTVTANPAIDYTYRLDSLAYGGLSRARTSTAEAAGKGVNVAKILRILNLPVRTIVTFGGPSGDLLLSLLPSDVIAVQVQEATRVNVTLIEDGGTTTKVNAADEGLLPAETDALVRAVTTALVDQPSTWMACCGSIPGETTGRLISRLVRAAHDAGAFVAIDTSGRALEAATAARADLLKPNAAELAELTGRSVRTLNDASRAARELIDGTQMTVLASVGACGASLVTADETWHAVPPQIAAVNTTGAGDALLAGYLAANSAKPRQRLAQAVALAASVCKSGLTAALPILDQRIDPIEIDVHPARSDECCLQH